MRIVAHLALLFVTAVSLLTSAHAGGNGLSGGADPDVTEFMLYGYKLKQWQTRNQSNPDKRAFDLKAFSTNLDIVMSTLHPESEVPARLHSTHDQLVDTFGTPKVAIFNIRTGKIVFNKSEWDRLSPEKRVVEVATEFMGFNGEHRYLNGLIVFQEAKAILDEYVNIKAIFDAIPAAKRVQVPPISTTAPTPVADAINWLKAALPEGIYSGLSYKQELCFLQVQHYPKNWIDYNGVSVEINSREAVISSEVSDKPWSLEVLASGTLKLRATPLSLERTFEDPDQGIGIGGAFPYFHRSSHYSHLKVQRNATTQELFVSQRRDIRVLGNRYLDNAECSNIKPVEGAQTYADAIRIIEKKHQR